MNAHPAGPVQPGMDTSPVIPPAGAVGFFSHLVHLGIGGVALGLAVNDGFAEGKATFAGEGWRVALTVAGAVYTFLAFRALLRVAGAKSYPVTRELRLRARRRGALIAAFGAGLFACATFDAVARSSIAFDSWTAPFFQVGGLLMLAEGLAFQMDITPRVRRRQLLDGPNVPGTATILGVEEIATTGDDVPIVKVEVEIDVNGRVYKAGDRIAIPREALASLTPGSTLDVVVDLVDPDVFKVDWKSWEGWKDAGLSIREE